MKKILALILVALMTVSMFAACGAKTETAASASGVRRLTRNTHEKTRSVMDRVFELFIHPR